MALWEKSMHLQGPLLETMKSLYGPKLPIEVRHYLANWIESQPWYVKTYNVYLSVCPHVQFSSFLSVCPHNLPANQSSVLFIIGMDTAVGAGFLFRVYSQLAMLQPSSIDHTPCNAHFMTAYWVILISEEDWCMFVFMTAYWVILRGACNNYWNNFL